MSDIWIQSNAQILQRIGQHYAEHRLAQNLTQGQLAEKAGVGVSTVHRFEKGQPSGLDTLVSILRALGLLHELSNLVAEVGVSPMALSQQAKPARQGAGTKRYRARPPKPKEVGSVAEERPTGAAQWVWGDDK